MTQMTDYQRELVTVNLSIVDHVVRKYIIINNKTMETYEDFYQIGCEALCKAAQSYNPASSSFSTYGSKVFRNALIDHCRAMNTRQKLQSGIDFEEWVSGSQFGCEAVSDYELNNLLDKEAFKALELCRKRYTGVVKMGLEALQLKALGYTTKEIAERHNTTTNNVNAWISKARAKLRLEPEIIKMAEG